MPFHVATRADDVDKHEFDVNQLIYHKGKLYSAGDDGKIKMWAPDLKFLKEVQAHPCSIYSITADGDAIYSCSNDGTVKSWELETLKKKTVFLEDKEVEFWKVKYDKGILYIGDDQGNVRMYKNETFYGSINVAIPVKDLAIKDNLMFASKDNDVIVTDLILQEEKPQFGIKATLMGRGPLGLVDNKVIFLSRDGKDILVNQIDEQQHLKETAKVVKAHDMIINGAIAVNWDGNPWLFTAGWDKVIKKWKIANDSLKADGSCNIDFIVNTMAYGDKDQIYAAGSDGHIARLDL
ncbi:uncharacterized protein LOC123006900 isoform X2 [Tribolium madens]|nr:uncharacterized protein LOC123006900 isoform X2 [Tribolium madens]XP_044257746.1 uncharacterized protein LOC123006900 isoform X2 [Tribolium madens]